MSVGLALVVLACSTLIAAFVFGPVLIAARGTLRPALGPQTAKDKASTLALGIAAGAFLAAICVGVVFGGDAAVLCATLTLLALLAVMDVAWRWLPMEWTAPLRVLGLGSAALTGTLTEAALGAAIGAGILLTLRVTYLVLRDIEAIGVGDIWLAAGLGALVGPAHIAWLLGAAACLGILLHILARPANRRRFGVAYGAQLCAVSPFFLPF